VEGAGRVAGDEARAGGAVEGGGGAGVGDRARVGLDPERLGAGDAARALHAVPRADLVVLNPPRKGCAEAVLAEVVRLGPRAVAYLSCDADTLARDLAWLAPRGYRAREVTPFDMLPHTPHVEALALIAPV